jgi:hypothetical protein
MCNRSIIPDSSTMKEIYQKYKDSEDNLLYINYTDVNAFG